MAYLVASFSDQLPALAREYSQGYFRGTLALVILVTAGASAAPGRSVKRSLKAFASIAAISSGLLAQRYWDLQRDYAGERLENARRMRQLEIIAERENGRFADTVYMSAPRAAPSARLRGMFGYGVITMSTHPDAKISKSAWLGFVRAEPKLRLLDSFQGINPFTREPVVFDVPGSAEVVHDGTAVGKFIWQDGRIFADGDEAVLTPIALRCAKALAADFQDEDGRSIEP